MSDIETYISSAEDPEQATAVAQEALQRASSTEEAPEIEDLPDGSVELAAGYMDLDGSVVRDAEVTEMTGAVEETLSRPAVQKNRGKLLTELIHSCTKNIGKHEPPSKDQIRELTIGDRELLAMKIRQVTYGDTFNIGQVRCPDCGHEFDVEYDLREDPPVTRIEDGATRFEVTLRRGQVVQMRLPNGHDQEYIAEDRNASIPERNHKMLSKCIEQIDGKPFVGGTGAIKKMGLADIRTLLGEIVKRPVGPQFSDVEQECPKCEGSFQLEVDLLDLFRY